ncbi:hypothetical protein [Actinomadura miaoliensis]|uniref:hypothetical protein n=1 Tax=Actinomadura miaoliensis TaxID=430685 RepID=UPI0031E59A5E
MLLLAAAHGGSFALGRNGHDWAGVALVIVGMLACGPVFPGFVPKLNGAGLSAPYGNVRRRLEASGASHAQARAAAWAAGPFALMGCAWTIISPISFLLLLNE